MHFYVSNFFSQGNQNGKIPCARKSLNYLYYYHDSDEDQKKQINKLTTENSEAKDKLKKLRAHKKPLKQSNLKTFVSIPSVDVDSSDDDTLDDDNKIPDSTQPNKDTLDNVATGSHVGSVFQCSGVVHKPKKRAWIDSDSTVK